MFDFPATVRTVFDSVPQPINPRGFSPADCPAYGLAVFTLKLPSLLQCDAAIPNGKEPAQLQNLKPPV